MNPICDGGKPLAPTRVVQAAARSSSQIQLHNQVIFLELAAAGQDPSARVDHEAVPVKHQLVLTADGITERQVTTVVEATCPQDLFAFRALPSLIRRCGDVHKHLGSAIHHRALRRPARIPEVLADRHADPDTVHVQNQRVCAGCEVSLFIEHAVIGQVALSVDGSDLPPRNHGRRVKEVI